jgi:hypothetical protein
MRLKTDAVLTNDPEKYLGLRDHEPSDADEPDHWPLADRMRLYLLSWLGFLIMTYRVWRFSSRGGWKEKLGNVEEELVEGGMSEKIQEVKSE